METELQLNIPSYNLPLGDVELSAMTVAVGESEKNRNNLKYTKEELTFKLAFNIFTTLWEELLSGRVPVLICRTMNCQRQRQ